MKSTYLLVPLLALFVTTGTIGFAYAQNDIVSDTTALITAFGALMGSVGGIIVAVVGFVSNSRKNDKLSEKEKQTYRDLEQIGISLQKTDRWVLENEGRFKDLVELVVKANPTIESTLKDKHLEIQSLTKQLEDAKKELDNYYDTVVPRVRNTQ